MKIFDVINGNRFLAAIGLGTLADPVTLKVSAGNIANPSGQFNRVADTNVYAIGDTVAQSVTPGQCSAVELAVGAAAAGAVMLRRARIRKTGANVGTFRIHLFRAAPVYANGDNVALSVSGSDNYVGGFDVACDRVFSDGVCGFGVPVVGSEVSVKLAAGQTSLWAVLEARSAYNPANAETFKITLDDLQD